MNAEPTTPEEFAAAMAAIQERAARARRLRDEYPDELAHLSLEDIDAVLQAVEESE